jgi:hypothetical protein
LTTQQQQLLVTLSLTRWRDVMAGNARSVSVVKNLSVDARAESRRSRAENAETPRKTRATPSPRELIASRDPGTRRSSAPSALCARPSRSRRN